MGEAHATGGCFFKKKNAKLPIQNYVLKTIGMCEKEIFKSQKITNIKKDK